MVSIIITSYNDAKTIRRAICSAIDQTYQNCEIIVVDDCSTDESHQIYLEFGDKINVISTPQNSGASYAREEGIQAAKGKYLTFIDADDYLDKTAIEHCVKCIEDTNADIVQMHIQRRVTCFGIPVNFKSKYDKSKALKACLFDEELFPIQYWGKLYQADIVNDITPIDYTGFWGEDRIFNLPIMALRLKIEIEPKAKYNYVWGGATSSQFDINSLQEYKQVYQIKKDWVIENRYEMFIPKMQNELVELLKYHIRHLINSGTMKKVNALEYLQSELSQPFWAEFNLPDATELYTTEKKSFNRTIKKITTTLLK